ncbi:hypothetical protein GUITHDRAFT_137817 [Guillardia theta CCMP2712]|uniref:Tyrosine-protein kinase ephrin type A/B receptor-like domain-containing protein n=1 Tax=Guillardia theta (strain CCMP2712) TaxID=905079 RepID=L1JFE9_GUITC|nr:hypothetical protein GUITHDRAFT_137817 [Guillardia theta CCMP2712]EKX46805.1 hypothetical protein GUITHDRAFT_137817 [Guillardia theta CCMP2712]|eukprot:XP_005833785.1 hypothetical protein GUITHDRAFT_137817 [Guillardia theta CCMP2712]
MFVYVTNTSTTFTSADECNYWPGECCGCDYCYKKQYCKQPLTGRYVWFWSYVGGDNNNLFEINELSIEGGCTGCPLHSTSISRLGSLSLFSSSAALLRLPTYLALVAVVALQLQRGKKHESFEQAKAQLEIEVVCIASTSVVALPLLALSPFVVLPLIALLLRGVAFLTVYKNCTCDVGYVGINNTNFTNQDFGRCLDICPANSTRRNGTDGCKCFEGHISKRALTLTNYAGGPCVQQSCQAICGNCQNNQSTGGCNCLAGYGYNENNGTCDLCPLGYHSINVANSDQVSDKGCVSCPVTTYGTPVSAVENTCTDCPSDSFAAPGSVSCTKCSSVCVNCSRLPSSHPLTGNFTTDCNCSTYFAYFASSSSCQRCAAGWEAYYTQKTGTITGSAYCTKCPDGTISKLPGSSFDKCLPCDSNSYCASGLETACPEYSSSPAGSANLFNCSCIQGYYRRDPLLCAICPKGLHCPDTCSVV